MKKVYRYEMIDSITGFKMRVRLSISMIPILSKLGM